MRSSRAIRSAGPRLIEAGERDDPKLALIDNLTAERDRYRARANLLENLLHDLADEVRAQKRTAAYQASHGQPATTGRRRIDIEGYLAKAGIEVKP